ncbi:hypothetical protein AB1L30_08750 [Bremerella sp. JC817]|uniref:hypothetical protein n=1 Tax=Bremerella sp. JC817 TaxID=3231756 RepID=UPI0034594DAD
MSDTFQTDSGEDDAALALFRILDEYGDESEEPGRIHRGDPLHHAISEYRRSLAPEQLPDPDKRHMRYMLRFSRSKSPAKRLTTQDLSDSWAAILCRRYPQIRSEYPHAFQPREQEMTPEQFQRWLIDCIKSNSQLENSLSVSTSLTSTTESSATTSRTSGKAKQPKSGVRQYSDAELRLIAALTNYHGYENGGISTFEPVGCRKLGKLAGVSRTAAYKFFRKYFDGHDRYKLQCNQPEKLTASMKLFNLEFSPKDFNSARTPADLEGEDDRLG